MFKSPMKNSVVFGYNLPISSCILWITSKLLMIPTQCKRYVNSCSRGKFKFCLLKISGIFSPAYFQSVVDWDCSCLNLWIWNPWIQRTVCTWWLGGCEEMINVKATWENCSMDKKYRKHFFLPYIFLISFIIFGLLQVLSKNDNALMYLPLFHLVSKIRCTNR